MNNFQIVNADTDSISFCRKDGATFSDDEKKILIKQINEISPEFMQWADDGYYKKVIILMAKNYVLQTEDDKIIYKGGAIKAPGKPLALREFIKRIIDLMLNDQTNYLEVYNEYVNEILDLKDIKRWSDRKTLTSTTFSSTRKNETKIVEAVKGTEYKEGDRIWVYFKPDKTLSLIENFNGEYDKDALFKKLYNTIEIFDQVLDVSQFPNYSLKGVKKKLLCQLDNQ